MLSLGTIQLKYKLFKNRFVERNVQYNDLLFRLIAALLAAHLIVANGEPENIFELLQLPFYFVCLAESFLIALIIVQLVYFTSCFLDAQYAWEKALNYRIIYQLVLAVMLPCCLACSLAWLYFKFNGIDILKTDYFKFDYKVIVLLIILLNTYYILHYVIKISRAAIPFEEVMDDVERVSGLPDVACIYSKDKSCFALTFEGTEFLWPHSLQKTLKDLPTKDYFLINRGFIINRSVIEMVKAGESRTLILKLIAPFEIEPSVSQRTAVEFKRWWGKRDIYNFQ